MDWISVEDRLPSKVGIYLCHFSDGGVETYDFEVLDDGRYCITDGYLGFAGFSEWQVTHWMPLPRPPNSPH